jgi:hypothetical protein
MKDQINGYRQEIDDLSSLKKGRKEKFTDGDFKIPKLDLSKVKRDSENDS